jgi:hypothetical protein
MREILPLLCALAAVLFTAVLARFAAVGVRLAFGLPILAGLAVYVGVAIFLNRKTKCLP